MREFNTLADFEKDFCEREIPTGWNAYAWIREHGNTAIAQSFFRTRRILNRADFVQVSVSGGKDSTLAFEIVSIELRYRKQLIEAVQSGALKEPYAWKPIELGDGVNDWENFEETDEAYESFENVNLNVPMVHLNSQDAELVFSDVIRHIQYDINLAHGYGLYAWNGKIVCGYDVVPSAVRPEGVETFSDLWKFAVDHYGEEAIEDVGEEALLALGIKKELVQEIVLGTRFSFAGKSVEYLGKDLTCIVRGDESSHMFYKCLSISYQNGSSYSSGRFVAWDVTKKDIWCRDMPTREEHGLDVITNYNMKVANLLPISKVKPELVAMHEDEIVEVEGVKCLPNWGFGSRSLCDIDPTYERLFGELIMKDEDGSYKELWTYVSQSDEDSTGSENDTFSKWLIANTPDEMTVDYVGGHPVTHPTQIYTIVSIRASESFERYSVLKQGIYFTGEYGRKVVG